MWQCEQVVLLASRQQLGDHLALTVCLLVRLDSLALLDADLAPLDSLARLAKATALLVLELLVLLELGFLAQATPALELLALLAQVLEVNTVLQPVLRQGDLESHTTLLQVSWKKFNNYNSLIMK